MKPESKQQILERRKEIEQKPPYQTFWYGGKLTDMLKETDFGTTPVVETSFRYGAGKKQLLEQKAKLKELFNSALAR